MSNEKEAESVNSLIVKESENMLVQRSRSVARRGLDLLDTMDRLIKFPENIAIGDVFLFDRNLEIAPWFLYLVTSRRESFEEFEFESKGGIKGDFSLKDAKQIALVININEPIRVEFLQTLHELKLDGILFLGETLESEFAKMSTFSGLRYLSLQGNFRDASPSSDRIKWIAKHHNLKLLDISDLALSVEDTAELMTLKSLEYIVLDSIDLTKEHTSYLSYLRSLRNLSLSYSGIDDDCFDYLLNLIRLEYLELAGNTDISNISIEKIHALKALKHLGLNSTSISDDALSSVALCEHLEELQLMDTAITNIGVSKICQLHSLCSLDLSGTDVNENCVGDIVKLRHLSRLDLRDLDFSDDAIIELKKYLPNCQILYHQTILGTWAYSGRYSKDAISL